MLEMFLTYLILSYLFVLAMGYLQTPSYLPGTQSERAEAANAQFYATLALTAVSVQAFASIMFLRGTVFFPAAAVFLAFTLLCHHAIIHRNSNFEGETCSCTPFQCKDVSNHETWVVAALVAGTVSLLHI